MIQNTVLFKSIIGIHDIKRIKTIPRVYSNSHSLLIYISEHVFNFIVHVKPPSSSGCVVLQNSFHTFQQTDFYQFQQGLANEIV